MRKKAISEQAGEAEIKSYHKPHPQHGNSQSWGNLFSLRSKVFDVYTGTLTLRPEPKRKAHKTSNFESQALKVHKTHKAIANRNSSLKAYLNSPDYLLEHRAKIAKTHPVFLWKRPIYAYLKALVWGAGIKFNMHQGAYYVLYKDVGQQASSWCSSSASL